MGAQEPTRNQHAEADEDQKSPKKFATLGGDQEYGDVVAEGGRGPENEETGSEGVV
jgi:hypothetical protein